MGNDGGSIPTRGDLVKTKRKRKIDPSEKEEKNRSKWLLCSLTQEPLQKHIVADQLGNVFNKEDVLRHLIDKTMPNQYKHIKSSKNLLELHLQSNKYYDSKANFLAGLDIDNLQSPFECPVTQRPMNGKHPFSALKVCGHVFYVKVLQEALQQSKPLCYVCQKSFSSSDIFPLHPDEVTLEKLKLELKQQQKKKSEKKESNTTSGDSSSTTSTATTTTTTTTSNTTSSTTTPSQSSTQETTSSSDDKEKHKKRKSEHDGTAKKKQKIETLSSATSLAVKVALEEAERNRDKKSSDVYKSIFTNTSPDPTKPQKPASFTGIYFAKH